MDWRQTVVAGSVIMALLASHFVAAQGPPPEQSKPQSTDSLVRRIDAETYAIGKATFNKRTKEVWVTGRVNQTEGLIEYLAVTPTGKTHEAVLTLDVQPMHLQTALLLLGANFGGSLRFQGDTTAPTGDTLQVYVKWRSAKGDSVTCPASDLIYDATSKKVMQRTGWIFTGSMLNQGRYMADQEGSLIATYSDPLAILNNPLEGRVVNGYRQQAAYEVNRDIVPEKGTPICLVIRR